MVASIGGSVVALRPFIVSSVPWQWELRSRDDLSGAKVNAELRCVDEDGLQLARQGSRHISLLSPPLHLPPGAGRVVSIEAALPGVGPGQRRSVVVKLLWQTENVPEFRFEPRRVYLDQHPRPIRFSLPRPPSEIYRLGVQFPGIAGPVAVRSISLPLLSVFSRLGPAWRQATAREPIDNYSINFLTGPQVLGHGLNYYLVSAMAACLGIYTMVNFLRRRRLSIGVASGVVLAAWFVADAQATWNLSRQAKDDVETFAGRSESEQIALAYGRDLAWCREQLLQQGQDGATFAVVSDDPFGPSHRLAYLLAPRRIRTDPYVDASFIVVIHSRTAVVDGRRGRFRDGAGPWVAAEMIAEFSPQVYLLRGSVPMLGADSHRLQTGDAGCGTRGGVAALWTLAALLIPWVTGVALMYGWCDRCCPLPLAIGGGWLIGQILVAALLYLTLLVSGASHARLILAGTALLGAAAWWRIVVDGLFIAKAVPMEHAPAPVGTRRHSAAFGRNQNRARPRPHRAVRIVLVVIGVSLLLKLGLFIAAHAYCPIRNDDAVSIWLFKAKVVAGMDTLVRDPSEPFYMGGSNPRYPVFVSLMAAWGPLVAGRWNEHLATLPWLGFYVSVPLLIAGGLRRWLTSRQAWVAAYIVASLPLLVIHAYRPGYADLPLDAFLAATVLYLLSWRTSGWFGHLLLAGLFAVAAACMKREGPPIVAAAALAVMVVSRRNLAALAPRVRAGLIALALLAVVAVAALVNLTDVAANVRAFGYHPEVWPALGRHLFAWSSFAFLFWALAAAAILVLFNPRAAQRRAALLLLLLLFGLDAAIFLFTPQARFALNDQTPSRLFLQTVPAVILAMAIPVATIVRRVGVDGSRLHDPKK